MAGDLAARIRADGEAGLKIDLSESAEADRTIDAAEFRELLTGRKAAKFEPSGLRLRGLRIVGPLDLSFCKIEVPIEFYESTFTDELNLARLDIPGLDFNRCTLEAVHAPSINVAVTLSFEGSTVSEKLTLIVAQAGGDLVLERLFVTTNGGSSPNLILSSAKVTGTCSLAGIDCSGMRARGMSIDSDLVLSGAQIGNEQMPRPRLAIDMVGCTVAGDVDLDGMVAFGEVWLADFKAGRTLKLRGACASNAGSDALTLDGAQVGDDVDLENLTANGTVRCVGSEISGALRLVECTLSSDDLALRVEGSMIKSALTLNRARIDGGIRIFQTSTGLLNDDLGVPLADGEARPLGSWTGATSIDLRGFTYARLADSSPEDSKLRCKWLESTTDFEPESWHHLSALYSASGQDAEARRVLIAREDDRVERMGNGPRKLWYKLFDLTVRYGYRPERAAFIGAAVVAAFAIWVACADSLTPVENAPSSEPQPVMYALDVFLPIIDFGLAGKWTATGALQWAQWTVIALGWALSTLFVAGYVRLIRDPK